MSDSLMQLVLSKSFQKRQRRLTNTSPTPFFNHSAKVSISHSVINTREIKKKKKKKEFLKEEETNFFHFLPDPIIRLRQEAREKEREKKLHTNSLFNSLCSYSRAFFVSLLLLNSNNKHINENETTTSIELLRLSVVFLLCLAAVYVFFFSFFFKKAASMQPRQRQDLVTIEPSNNYTVDFRWSEFFLFIACFILANNFLEKGVKKFTHQEVLHRKELLKNEAIFNSICFAAAARQLLEATHVSSLVVHSAPVVPVDWRRVRCRSQNGKRNCLRKHRHDC
jgi:hypothetical protein